MGIMRKRKNNPYVFEEVRILDQGLRLIETNEFTKASRPKAYRKFDVFVNNTKNTNKINPVLLRQAKAGIISSARQAAYIGNQQELLNKIQLMFENI